MQLLNAAIDSNALKLESIFLIPLHIRIHLLRVEIDATGHVANIRKSVIAEDAHCLETTDTVVAVGNNKFRAVEFFHVAYEVAHGAKNSILNLYEVPFPFLPDIEQNEFGAVAEKFFNLFTGYFHGQSRLCRFFEAAEELLCFPPCAEFIDQFQDDTFRL